MNKLKSISIVKIQPEKFEINEKLKIKNSGKDLNVNFDIGYEFHLKGQLMSFTITIQFRDKKKTDDIYAQSSVKSIFNLQFENNNLSKESKVDIDKQSLITMLSLSISHTRAIMATYTNGTSHEQLVVPIINPTALFTETLEKELRQSIQAEFEAEMDS